MGNATMADMLLDGHPLLSQENGAIDSNCATVYMQYTIDTTIDYHNALYMHHSICA